MMKKILSIILCVLLVVSLAGCKNESVKDDSQTASSISETTKIPMKDVTSSESEDKKSDDINLKGTTMGSTEESTSAYETESQQTEKETTEKAETQAAQSEETKPQSTPTKKQPDKTTTEETTTTPTETKPAITEPSYVRPTASEVENAVAKYVNQFRIAQGDTKTTVLPGLTNVARYRANQLISNFAHTDIRATCAELKYGKYVDLTEYGHPESDNYYEGYNREAIAKGGWGGTADEIAERIATGFKNSTNHWRYVGDSKYSYMSVGATYNEADGQWYICICMSKENYGG